MPINRNTPYAIATPEDKALASSGGSARDIAKSLAKTNGCNCDLDNWEPEASTGHSWVCRIHKTASELRDEYLLSQPVPNVEADARRVEQPKVKHGN